MGCEWLMFHNAASGPRVHRVIPEVLDLTRKRFEPDARRLGHVLHKFICEVAQCLLCPESDQLSGHDARSCIAAESRSKQISSAANIAKLRDLLHRQ